MAPTRSALRFRDMAMFFSLPSVRACVHLPCVFLPSLCAPFYSTSFFFCFFLVCLLLTPAYFHCCSSTVVLRTCFSSASVPRPQGTFRNVAVRRFALLPMARGDILERGSGGCLQRTVRESIYMLSFRNPDRQQSGRHARGHARGVHRVHGLQSLRAQ